MTKNAYIAGLYGRREKWRQASRRSRWRATFLLRRRVQTAPAAAANLSAFVSADSVCELTRYNRMKADRKPVRGKFDLFKRPDTGKE